MKNFANNTFWRRAAITLLLAVITTTAALAQGNTLTMVNAKNTVWSNMKKLLYSESDSTGRPGFNFRSLFADDDSPGSSQMNADCKLSSISEPLSIEPPSIKSTFADESNIHKEYQIMSKAKSISLWLLCNPLTNLNGVPLPALAYPIKKRNHKCRTLMIMNNKYNLCGVIN